VTKIGRPFYAVVLMAEVGCCISGSLPNDAHPRHRACELAGDFFENSSRCLRRAERRFHRFSIRQALNCRIECFALHQCSLNC
jgi:hypothetical protein